MTTITFDQSKTVFNTEHHKAYYAKWVYLGSDLENKRDFYIRSLDPKTFPDLSVVYGVEAHQYMSSPIQYRSLAEDYWHDDIQMYLPSRYEYQLLLRLIEHRVPDFFEKEKRKLWLEKNILLSIVQKGKQSALRSLLSKGQVFLTFIKST